MVVWCMVYEWWVSLQLFASMKEQRRSKDVREKIKEKMGRKPSDKDDLPSEETFEKIKDYKIYINEMIGEGSYGRVYKARSENNDELLACKIISKSRLENMKMYNEQVASELQNRIKTESEFHKKLSGCPYIVKLIDTFENKKAYYFIMQYCESDLSKIIKDKGVLTEETALKYFTEMVEGYRSIYSNNAFHRDLKPENLLLKDDSIKISDFGFVKIFTDIDRQCKSGKNKLRTQSKVGSIKYMSPDVLNVATNLSTYNAEKSDIWSMGIILYKMLYGKEPFHGKDEEEIIKNISQKELKFPDTAKISPEVIKNTKISSDVKRLLKKMIEKDEEARLSFKKLYGMLRDLKKTKEQEKQEKLLSGINEEAESKERGEGEAKNKKEELLLVYNKLLVKIYHDNTNYATLQEVGVQNYFQVGYKLICLIHEKRTTYLESEDDEDDQQVSQKIKQDISLFHNYFAEHVKKKIELTPEQTLEKLLLDIYPKIKTYADFEELMLDVEIFLVDLLLLLALELKIVKPDYVYTWSMRCDNYKQKSILNYKQNAINMIEAKLNNQQKQPEDDDRANKKDKHKEKKHRSKNKDKSKDQPDNEQNKREQSKDKDKDKEKDKDRDKEKEKQKDKDKEKEKEREGSKQHRQSKKSRQKQQDKHKSREKKSKK